MKYGRTQTGHDRRGQSMKRYWELVRRYAAYKNISLTAARDEIFMYPVCWQKREWPWNQPSGGAV